jgi:MHS family citrate/tricarballylate:H+ symporter-like MFS transporter
MAAQTIPEALMAKAASVLPELSPSQRRQVVVAATTGNALEFYDFVTFTFFAIQIGETFFPSHDKYASLMASLATFWVGFLTRPLGAYVLGGYGDRHGRKPAMLISMTMMGAAIAVLALTPGYAQIGLAAPVIAVLARMLQGFALGGEVGSATVYMMEGAQEHRRDLAISWQGASQQLSASVGALVGLILSLALSQAQLSQFGWRIALLLGTVIVPFALVMRRSLPDTIEVHGAAPPPAVPLRPFLRPILCGFVMIAAGTISTYIFHYMATFGQNSLGLSPRISMAGQLANEAIGFFFILLAGLMSDRIGRRPVMIAGKLAFCVLVIPCFVWLVSGRDAVSFIGANLILSAADGIAVGSMYAAIIESLPQAIRVRAFALIYSLPVCIFGGSTQLVVTWILRATGSPMALAVYLTVVSIIGVIAMYLIRESAPVRINALARALASAPSLAT